MKDYLIGVVLAAVIVFVGIVCAGAVFAHRIAQAVATPFAAVGLAK